jgi:LPXTG-motif cell wall-anchored protein
LPKTASALPLIVVFGLGCIGVAAGFMAFGKRATAAVK